MDPNPSTPPEAPASQGHGSQGHGGPDLTSGVFKLLRDVEVEVTLEIGRRRMKIADVLKLKAGQNLDLPKGAGEPLDILVNGQLLARGEAIVVGDRYGVRITEFAAPLAEILK